MVSAELFALHAKSDVLIKNKTRQQGSLKVNCKTT